MKRILMYGDVVGKLGRAGVKITLPKFRQKYAPDLVVANVENIAHGKGIGMSQISELRNAGVDVCTGGNHSIEGKDADKILNDEAIPITRPLNMSSSLPGRGALWVQGVMIINAIGRVHMRQQYDSPFHAIDTALSSQKNETPYVLVDWHAEATSEKTVMGWYLDGKVSAVVGTHTHVPTADAKILPRGTAYISDIGMVGPHHSIIGVEVSSSLERFRDQAQLPLQVVESGPIEVNAVYIEIGDDGRAVDIKHLREVITDYRI